MASQSTIAFPERFFNTPPKDHDKIEGFLINRGVDPEFHVWFINHYAAVAANHAKPDVDRSVSAGFPVEEMFLEYLRRPSIGSYHYCHMLEFYRMSPFTKGKPHYSIIPRGASTEERNKGQETLYNILHQTGKARKAERRRRRKKEKRQAQQGGASAVQGPPEAEEEEIERMKEVLQPHMGGTRLDVGIDLPFRGK